LAVLKSIVSVFAWTETIIANAAVHFVCAGGFVIFVSAVLTLPCVFVDWRAASGGSLANVFRNCGETAESVFVQNSAVSVFIVAAHCAVAEEARGCLRTVVVVADVAIYFIYLYVNGRGRCARGRCARGRAGLLNPSAIFFGPFAVIGFVFGAGAA